MIPSLRGSTIPSLRGSMIPSLRGSTIPSPRGSTIPSLRGATILSADAMARHTRRIGAKLHELCRRLVAFTCENDVAGGKLHFAAQIYDCSSVNLHDHPHRIGGPIQQ
jgi:hypothetical protein